MPDGLSEAEAKVFAAIDADEIRELTSTLVAAPGENPPGGERATAETLLRCGRERGLDGCSYEVEPERPNVSLSVPGGDGPGLLLLGHTDVVPIGEGWTTDPLGGEVRDGRIFGRGSADMKGGLAACVIAMAALRTAGTALSGPVELSAVVDEEETGKGIRHDLATRDRSGLAGCIVAEPTDLQAIIAARGDAYLQVDVHGRAAHSGNPSDGVNAIYGAAAVVADLELWHHEMADAPHHRLVGAPTWNVGQVTGGTGTSIVPADCRVVADRRLLPDEDGATVLEATRARLGCLGLSERGLTFDVRLTMEMPGFETDEDDAFVRLTDRCLTESGGPRLPVGGWTAACDGGFLARAHGIPVVVLGAGSVATQAHRADESVAIDELLVAARTYALTAMRLLTRTEDEA